VSARLGLALLLALPVAAPAIAAGPFPYAIDVKVRYESGVGFEGLIDTLEQRLTFELARGGCYRQVIDPHPEPEPQGDLLLLLTLSELEERTDFEATAAQREQAFDPATRRALVAEFSVKVAFQLVLSDELRIVRSSSTTVSRSARPIMAGHEEEWARREARDRAVARIVKMAVRKACSGSPARLAAEIEQARAAGD